MGRYKYPLNIQHNYRLSMNNDKCSTCKFHIKSTDDKKRMVYYSAILDHRVYSNWTCDAYEKVASLPVIKRTEHIITTETFCKLILEHPERQFNEKVGTKFMHKYSDHGDRVLIFKKHKRLIWNFVLGLKNVDFEKHFEVI